MLTIFGWNFEIWAVQKYVNLVDLVKSFPTSIYLQKSASIQPRTSLSKFGGKLNSFFIRLLSRYRRCTRPCCRRCRRRCGCRCRRRCRCPKFSLSQSQYGFVANSIASFFETDFQLFCSLLFIKTLKSQVHCKFDTSRNDCWISYILYTLSKNTICRIWVRRSCKQGGGGGEIVFGCETCGQPR